MKKSKYIAPFLAFVVLSTGCKKYLDVNNDPNNPSDVQESLILFPVETAISTTIAGSNLTIGNYTSIGDATNYWVQQTALNQTAPQLDEYRLRPSDLDQAFLACYSNVFQNLKILNSKAEQHVDHSYGVIAKVLTAYTLGVVTDVWGDVPYSQAFYGNLKVPYDKQEDVYKTIQSLLDSAITENALAPGVRKPGNDDAIYSGDMSKWQKFAYTLKARYYMHLTKAPGYNAATQAGLALAALQNGFASRADEAAFALYSNSAGSESPWSQNIIPGVGPIVLASTLIDSLASRNDPRLPILATKGSGGNYRGRIIGSDVAPDFKVYSTINSFYASKSSPSFIVNYSEALFLQAEAVFRTSGAAAANPIYINGINSHMSKLGLDTTSAPVLAYIAARGTLTSQNALQRIMEEKTLANFLSLENYNDWRRTGYPLLTIVQNAYTTAIARRFPYPLQELTANPQPQQNVALTDRVWWDTAP